MTPYWQCGASTGAIRLGDAPPHHIGPCVLRKDHDGPVHQAQDGTQWAGDIGRAPEAAPRLDVPARGVHVIPGDLRERLAHAMAHAPGTVYQACNDDMYLRIADAVLPVVEAALAQQAAEIDEDIIKPERALHEQTIQRAEQAEQQRDAALAALRELIDGRPCAPHPGNGWCQTHGERAPCPHAEAKKLATPDQPEETR